MQTNFHNSSRILQVTTIYLTLLSDAYLAPILVEEIDESNDQIWKSFLIDGVNIKSQWKELSQNLPEKSSSLPTQGELVKFGESIFSILKGTILTKQ
jgi:hypothetical protein